jgi:hypothetical protein
VLECSKDFPETKAEILLMVPGTCNSEDEELPRRKAEYTHGGAVSHIEMWLARSAISTKVVRLFKYAEAAVMSAFPRVKV